MCQPENIKNNPDTDDLIKEGETKEDLANGTIDDFLKCWVNKHLKAAGYKEPLGRLFVGEIYNAFSNPYNVNEKEC